MGWGCEKSAHSRSLSLPVIRRHKPNHFLVASESLPITELGSPREILLGVKKPARGGLGLLHGRHSGKKHRYHHRRYNNQAYSKKRKISFQGLSIASSMRPFLVFKHREMISPHAAGFDDADGTLMRSCSWPTCDALRRRPSGQDPAGPQSSVLELLLILM